MTEYTENTGLLSDLDDHEIEDSVKSGTVTRELMSDTSHSASPSFQHIEELLPEDDLEHHELPQINEPQNEDEDENSVSHRSSDPDSELEAENESVNGLVDDTNKLQEFNDINEHGNTIEEEGELSEDSQEEEEELSREGQGEDEHENFPENEDFLEEDRMEEVNTHQGRKHSELDQTENENLIESEGELFIRADDAENLEDTQQSIGDQENNDENSDDSGSDDDLELLGSRQVSVVEIDSEDEIENLEESELFQKEESLIPLHSGPAESCSIRLLEKPVLVATLRNEYLLVSELNNREGVFPDHQAILLREKLTNALMRDVFRSLRSSSVMNDIRELDYDDYLRLTVNKDLTFNEKDSRIQHVSFLRILEGIQQLSEMGSDGNSFVKITVELDENPVSKLERLRKAFRDEPPASMHPKPFDSDGEDGDVPKRQRLS